MSRKRVKIVINLRTTTKTNESYLDFEVVSLASLCFGTQEFMELEIERRRNTLKEE